jgi:uncharacterized membrane protein YhaH (DUF805 family)
MLMFQPLKKYADFKGRARRSEYWLFALFIIIVEVILIAGLGGAGSMGMAGGGEPTGALGIGGILLIVFVLAIIVPSLAVSFRRLHDTNRSAWWLLINFLPVVGPFVLLFFMVLDGTHGPNRFGPDPKDRGTEEVFA